MTRKQKGPLKDAGVSKETLKKALALGKRMEPLVRKLSEASKQMKPEQVHAIFEFFSEATDNDLFLDKRALDGFGPRIKLLREFLGLTLDEFAGFLKEHPSQISMVETGKRRPSLLLLLNICIIFKMSPKRLFGEWIWSGSYGFLERRKTMRKK